MDYAWPMPSPHQIEEVLRLGPEDAGVTVIAVHGRDQGPEWMVAELVDPVGDRSVAWFVPRASEGVWYPGRFDDPVAMNEPHVSAALERLAELVGSTGADPSTVILTGFSQGACLVNEFVARHPHRWGGLVSFTGGRIGPPCADLTIAGDLAGTPVRLSAGAADPWVSPAAVRAAAASFAAAGAAVSVRLFDGDADHRIRACEVEDLRMVIGSVGAGIRTED